jgi:hypothetical protein
VDYLLTELLDKGRMCKEDRSREDCGKLRL